MSNDQVVSLAAPIDAPNPQCRRCIVIIANGITLRCADCPVNNGLLLPDHSKIPFNNKECRT